MVALPGYIIGIAILLGLLLTGLPDWELSKIPPGAAIMLGLGIVAALGMPRLWRKGPRSQVWLVAGLFGAIATLYFQIHLPHPGSQDISRWVQTAPETPVPAVQIQGEIASVPQLTRSQRVKFELETATLAPLPMPEKLPPSSVPVKGRLYVTVPLLQGTGLYPGEHVTVVGSLYKPQPPNNPGGFDFQAYLARKGMFAGLDGQQVEPVPGGRSPSVLWRLRQRIVRSLVAGLDSPAGSLLSAIVLGQQAVDLPYDIRDQFTQAGLAHALAASGFQVSMLLGLVLALTQRQSPYMQAGAGLLTLGLYLGMTGVQPSIARATLMGGAVLLAPLLKRKTKPLGVLLVVAIALLLINPLWIWDLGFQFSFLATLGLLVTVPPLTKWLDWLPMAIATVIAVPVAAFVWTFPVQLYAFGTFSTYSLPLNIITTPLISLISVWGVISAIAAAISPALGSGMAWLLSIPIQGLTLAVTLCNHIPYSVIAIGSLSSLQLVLIYSLFGAAWWGASRRHLVGAASLVIIGLILVPGAYLQASQIEITVLAADRDTILVVQDHGHTGLVDSGSESAVQFSLLPFLRQHGVNQLDWAIATPADPSTSDGWTRLRQAIPIRSFYEMAAADARPALASATPPLSPPQSQISSPSALPLALQQPVPLGDRPLQALQLSPSLLQLQLAEQCWLIYRPTLTNPAPAAALPPNPCEVFWWSGEALPVEILAAAQPSVAIASSAELSADLEQWFRDHQTTLYRIGREGALRWSPSEGFQALLSPEK